MRWCVRHGWLYHGRRIPMETEKKTKSFTLRVSEDDWKRIKDAAIDQRYMNLSEFIRDAINEKIEIWEENQEEDSWAL